MKRAMPLDDSSSDSKMEVNHDSDNMSTDDLPVHQPLTDFMNKDALIRRAKMYQDYMKRIPIPVPRESVIPFTSWMGLGRSMKELYGQPLHYLTNILLTQWDQLRVGSAIEHEPLDIVIHPCKAEATIWLIEELHRKTSSPSLIAKLWMVDSMHHASVDSIFPKLENS